MSKLLINAIVLAGFVLVVASCQYKFIIEPVEPPPNPVDTIFFTQDILPIWNDGQYCTSCHNTSGTSPDLTPDYAYDEITNSGLVDTQNPSESVIYKLPHPDTETHSWKKYSGSQAATLLQWIEQGAIDN